MKNNVDEMKKEFLDNIDNYHATINAWNGVKRLSKKDGSDFANFSKNFEGATYEKRFEYVHSTLTVNFRRKNGCYHDIVDVDDNDTVDDVFKKIRERITYLELNIKHNENKLAHADEVFNEVDRVMKQVIAFSADGGFNKYEISQYIKDNIYNYK